METLLKNFEECIVWAAEKYKIQVVKSIWDAYLSFAETVEDAKDFALEALSSAQKYDAGIRIDLMKIAPRATISYGKVHFRAGKDLSDYFGDAINLASRMMEVTPSYCIFTDKKAVSELKNASEYEIAGKFSFQGVLEQQEIFSLTQLTQTQKDTLSHGGKDELWLLFESCDELVFRASCVAALLMLQPIPFIESYNIIAVHLYMVIKLSQKFGRPVNLQSGGKIFLEIVTPLSLSYVGIQGLGSMSKLLLPGVGGIIFAPITFAVTYALWKVYMAYFFSQIAERKLSGAEIRSIFYKQKDIGKNIAKTQKREIYKIGKQFSWDVLSIKETPGYKRVQTEVMNMIQSKK